MFGVGVKLVGAVSIFGGECREDEIVCELVVSGKRIVFCCAGVILGF